MTSKHTIEDENTLDLLESVYIVYSQCGISNNYSETITVSVQEFLRKKRTELDKLLSCVSKKLKGALTFPYMLRWKDEGRALFISDVKGFSINDFKHNPDIAEYIESKLLYAPVVKIDESPEQKTIFINDDDKEIISFIKDKYKLNSIDDALTTILTRTAAYRLIVTLTRLIHDTVTISELTELFGEFGMFYFIFAFERDRKTNYIKIVHEFFPYNYDFEFAKIILR
uniref:Uncharacterized protein n=1 Tax=Saccharolobus islandicus TaxID=43080 RepID=Q9HH90_SACIS|nr:hypothetical protein [Sulfolobus islandicus]CAC15843.1 hypothetical protein [Sulfolobus islandicus]